MSNSGWLDEFLALPDARIKPDGARKFSTLRHRNHLHSEIGIAREALSEED
jgi:hypothetical protein